MEKDWQCLGKSCLLAVSRVCDPPLNSNPHSSQDFVALLCSCFDRLILTHLHWRYVKAPMRLIQTLKGILCVWMRHGETLVFDAPGMRTGWFGGWMSGFVYNEGWRLSCGNNRDKHTVTSSSQGLHHTHILYAQMWIKMP